MKHTTAATIAREILAECSAADQARLIASPASYVVGDVEGDSGIAASILDRALTGIECRAIEAAMVDAVADHIDGLVSIAEARLDG